MYRPTPFPENLDAEIPFEEVEFRSADGTLIHGWFADHPDPAGVALFCHGNGGNIVDCGDSLMILNRRHHLAVMVFDYRGYGRSQGKPHESGILADARAARKWLADRKQVLESDIVLMGRSLGGGVAVDLASKDGAKGRVLVSTFTSLPDVAKGVLPIVPAKLVMTQRFNSLAKIKNYHGPLLQTHGVADRLIPIEQARKLFAAAPTTNKKFIAIANGDHNAPQPEEYRMALDGFLNAIQ